MARTHWYAAPARILLVGLIAMTALAELPVRDAQASIQSARSGTYRNAPVSAVAASSTSSFDVVSATGGSVGGVAVAGNYAYFAEGAGLTVLNISNALLPAQVARLVLPAIAQDVQVAGNLVYITTSKGLYIIDAGDPARPNVLGSYATPGSASAVRIVGTRAYVTVGGVYDPAAGDYVGKGLQIVDISTATHPVLLGSYATSDFPGDVQVAGNLAYLLHNDSSSAGLRILDITNPAQIAAKGDYALPGKNGRAVKVANGKAYIGYNAASAFDGGLLIVNVSTPSSPSLLGSYATPQPVWDVQITGNLAFLAAHAQLIALNITSPSNPSLISAYQISGIDEAMYDGLQVVNGMAYLATEGFTHEQIVGIQIVDVHTPAAPAARGAYRTLFSIAAPSNPNPIKLAGATGYAVGSGQIRAFDIANPARPTFMATSAPTISYDLDLVGDRLYNAGGKSGLQVFDISNQSSPTLLGSYTEPDITIDRVRVAGSRAYVAADFKLKIIDISNPGNPVLLGQASTGGYPLSVDVAGTLVYVTTEYGLSIMDASDPANITVYAGYRPDAGTNAVEVVGQRAYLAGRGYYESNVGIVKQGLYIADISDPDHPQQLGRYATPGQALAVQVAGDRAYVADLDETGLAALLILDISDPTHPSLLSTYDLPSQAGGMLIAGDLLYVAGGNAGLLVLRFQDSIVQSGQLNASGGVLAFGDTLALTFPPGAATSPLTVTYSLLQQPTHALSSGQQALRNFALEARDGAGALVTHFAKPYTLTISYTDQLLAAHGIAEAELNLAFWNGSAWVNVLPCEGCGVDTANNRLTAVLDHFTEFALVGNAASDGKSRVYLPVVLR